MTPVRLIAALFAAVAVTFLLLLLALPAHAEEGPFSVASFDYGDVLLFNEKGPCEGDAMLAHGAKKNVEKDTGCWVPNGAYIQVAWLDGAVDRIPVRSFKKPETL